MAQIFHPSTNTFSRFTIYLVVVVVLSAGAVFGSLHRSPYLTQANVVRTQPVPFSHRHHVREVGLDCRYCHTSVEDTAVAGIPPTKTCMNCHSQVWKDSPMLAPVQDSYRTGASLQWVRVHDLADFAYFDHSIHVKKGIGCSTCHGQVDDMPLMWRDATLLMAWCLECHRAPEKFVRPRSEVFNMSWKPGPNQEEVGRALVSEHKIKNDILSDCSTCHR